MEQVLVLFRLASTACGTNSGVLPSLYDGITCQTDKQGGVGPSINSIQDVLRIIGNGVRILTAVSGGIAIIVIVVAAIFYITSMGDPGRIKAAKDILINVTIGLVLITIAYALMTYVAKFF